MSTVNLRGVLQVVSISLVAAAGAAYAQDNASEGEASTAAALTEVRKLAAGLEAYPQHEEDVVELRSILSEFEQTSTKVEALEAGVQERGNSLRAPQIQQQISVQYSRAGQLERRIRAKRWEEQEAILDSSIDDAKSNYEEARQQYLHALKILQGQMSRQQQAVQKITN